MASENRQKPQIQYSIPLPGSVRITGGAMPPLTILSQIPVLTSELPTRRPITIITCWVGGQGDWEYGIRLQWADGTRYAIGPDNKEIRFGRRQTFKSPIDAVFEVNRIDLEIDRHGLLYVILDLEGEEVLRYPLRVIEGETIQPWPR